MTIPVVDRDDAGLYSCVAHNSVGRDRCTCLIYVDGSGVQQRKANATSTTVVETDKRPPQPPKIQHSTSSSQIEVLKDLPKILEINEGEELRLFCVVKSDVHLIRKFRLCELVSIDPKINVRSIIFAATWTKAGRTLTFDGRRRITRNLMGEMCLVIDQAMTTDAGRYTLTITPSDATLAETMEPVVLNAQVEVHPKIQSRVRYF